MTRDLDLGFIALLDAAPLIVARERGFFEAEGLNVTLRREVSWATIRDRVAVGLYQGAHILAPTLLAVNMGVSAVNASLMAPLSLCAHGASFGVSRALAAEMAAAAPDAPASAAALKAAIAARRARGAHDVRIAVVFPFSMHNYMLRHWASVGGLDPDRDFRIVVAPPTAMAERLRSGEIDGFSVGAPWSAACESESGAQIVLRAGTFWPGGPDKVLGLSAAWAERDAEGALAVTRAVLSAAHWADANPEALAALLARSDLIGTPASLLTRAMGMGQSTGMRFAREDAAYPRKAHAAWMLTQMMRWGQIDAGAVIARAAAAYRPDLYRDAAAALGLPAPSENPDAAGMALGEKTPPTATFDAQALARAAAAYPITRAARA